MRPEPLTVLVVDDHAAFRASAARLLEAAGFVVIGEAGTAEQAIAAVEAYSPAVVLLDVQLPDCDGIDVAGQLAARSDPPRVVLISGRDPRVYGDRLTRAAARGFIPKAKLTGARLCELLE